MPKLTRHLFIAALSLGALSVVNLHADAAALTTTQSQAIINLLQSFGADSATIARVQVALAGGGSSSGGTTVPSGIITSCVYPTPPTMNIQKVGSTYDANISRAYLGPLQDLGFFSDGGNAGGLTLPSTWRAPSAVDGRANLRLNPIVSVANDGAEHTVTYSYSFTTPSTIGAYVEASIIGGVPGGGFFTGALATKPDVYGYANGQCVAGDGVVWPCYADPSGAPINTIAAIIYSGQVGIPSENSVNKFVLQPNTTYYLNAKRQCAGSCGAFFTIVLRYPGQNGTPTPTATQIASFVPQCQGNPVATGVTNSGGTTTTTPITIPSTTGAITVPAGSPYAGIYASYQDLVKVISSIISGGKIVLTTGGTGNTTDTTGNTGGVCAPPSKPVAIPTSCYGLSVYNVGEWNENAHGDGTVGATWQEPQRLWFSNNRHKTMYIAYFKTDSAGYRGRVNVYSDSSSVSPVFFISDKPCDFDWAATRNLYQAGVDLTFDVLADNQIAAAKNGKVDTPFGPTAALGSELDAVRGQILKPNTYYYINVVPTDILSLKYPKGINGGFIAPTTDTLVKNLAAHDQYGGNYVAWDSLASLNKTSGFSDLIIQGLPDPTSPPVCGTTGTTGNTGNTGGVCTPSKPVAIPTTCFGRTVYNIGEWNENAHGDGRIGIQSQEPDRLWFKNDRTNTMYIIAFKTDDAPYRGRVNAYSDTSVSPVEFISPTPCDFDWAVAHSLYGAHTDLTFNVLADNQVAAAKNGKTNALSPALTSVERDAILGRVLKPNTYYYLHVVNTDVLSLNYPNGLGAGFQTPTTARLTAGKDAYGSGSGYLAFDSRSSFSSRSGASDTNLSSLGLPAAQSCSSGGTSGSGTTGGTTGGTSGGSSGGSSSGYCPIFFTSGASNSCLSGGNAAEIKALCCPNGTITSCTALPGGVQVLGPGCAYTPSTVTRHYQAPVAAETVYLPVISGLPTANYSLPVGQVCSQDQVFYTDVPYNADGTYVTTTDKSVCPSGLCFSATKNVQSCQ